MITNIYAVDSIFLTALSVPGTPICVCEDILWDWGLPPIWIFFFRALLVSCLLLILASRRRGYCRTVGEPQLGGGVREQHDRYIEGSRLTLFQVASAISQPNEAI